MEICGFEKFSLVDFDGKIACTVFTNGCNLRCPFCHNQSLVYGVNKADIINNNEVFEYLNKRKNLVDAVCVSGGEPTLQHDLTAFIERVKAMGLLVKLDTNGTNPDKLEELLNKKLLDYVAMDIKNSPLHYAKTSGRKVDMNGIEKSVRLIMSSVIDYEFRTTIIREFHNADDIAEISKMIGGAKKYVLQKYVDNDDCIEHGFSAVEIDTAKDFVEIAKPYVGSVSLRGY